VRNESVLRVATRVGWVSAAATAGALLGFGMRVGAPAWLFSAAGDRLRGVPAFVAPDRAFRLSAALGTLHHVALLLAWSLAFTLVARRLRGGRLAAAAVATSLFAVVADAALPPALRQAAGAMTLGQRAVYGIVLAAALAVGMRLAQRDPARV